MRVASEWDILEYIPLCALGASVFFEGRPLIIIADAAPFPIHTNSDGLPVQRPIVLHAIAMTTMAMARGSSSPAPLNPTPICGSVSIR